MNVQEQEHNIRLEFESKLVFRWCVKRKSRV